MPRMAITVETDSGIKERFGPERVKRADMSPVTLSAVLMDLLINGGWELGDGDRITVKIEDSDD